LTYAVACGIILTIGGGQMARVDKLVDKMKRQPNAITIEEADKVLEYYGYKFVKQTGSHRKYRNDKGEVISIPRREQAILAVYVKLILERIEG